MQNVFMNFLSFDFCTYLSLCCLKIKQTSKWNAHTFSPSVSACIATEILGWEGPAVVIVDWHLGIPGSRIIISCNIVFKFVNFLCIFV